MLTSSTTAVSGEKSKGTGPGGIVRAVLPRSKTYRLLDWTGRQRTATDALSGYVDPSVPCGIQRTATWYFIDGNPSPAAGERHLYGWTAVKVATPLPPDPAADSNRIQPCGP